MTPYSNEKRLSFFETMEEIMEELDKHFRYKLYDNPKEFFDEIYIKPGLKNDRDKTSIEEEVHYYFECRMPLSEIIGYLVIYECLTDKYRIWRGIEGKRAVMWNSVYKYCNALIYKANPEGIKPPAFEPAFFWNSLLRYPLERHYELVAQNNRVRQDPEDYIISKT